jgi:hypothetical protein
VLWGIEPGKTLRGWIQLLLDSIETGLFGSETSSLRTRLGGPAPFQPQLVHSQLTMRLKVLKVSSKVVTHQRPWGASKYVAVSWLHWGTSCWDWIPLLSEL